VHRWAALQCYLRPNALRFILFHKTHLTYKSHSETLYKPFAVFFILRGLGSYTARPSSRAAMKFSNRFLHCFGDRYVRLQPLTMSATRSQFGMCAGDSAMRLNGNSCNVCSACSNTSQPELTPLYYKHKENIITVLPVIRLNNTQVHDATKNAFQCCWVFPCLRDWHAHLYSRSFLRTGTAFAGCSSWWYKWFINVSAGVKPVMPMGKVMVNMDLYSALSWSHL